MGTLQPAGQGFHFWLHHFSDGECQVWGYMSEPSPRKMGRGWSCLAEGWGHRGRKHMQRTAPCLAWHQPANIGPHHLPSSQHNPGLVLPPAPRCLSQTAFVSSNFTSVGLTFPCCGDLEGQTVSFTFHHLRSMSENSLLIPDK